MSNIQSDDEFVRGQRIDLLRRSFVHFDTEVNELLGPLFVLGPSSLGETAAEELVGIVSELMESSHGGTIGWMRRSGRRPSSFKRFES